MKDRNTEIIEIPDSIRELEDAREIKIKNLGDEETVGRDQYKKYLEEVTEIFKNDTDDDYLVCQFKIDKKNVKNVIYSVNRDNNRDTLKEEVFVKSNGFLDHLLLPIVEQFLDKNRIVSSSVEGNDKNVIYKISTSDSDYMIIEGLSFMDIQKINDLLAQRDSSKKNKIVPARKKKAGIGAGAIIIILILLYLLKNIFF